jgi:hypothetical protein
VAVKAGGPAFRITIRRTSLDSSESTPVRLGEIEVARCQDGTRLQVLPIMAWQPIDFARSFEAVDIDFDGYLDLSVAAERGAKWGRQLWWVYDPATGRFVQNELTHELGELTTNGYQIDRNKHEIVADNLMAGCPSLVTRYRVEDNRLIKIHEETGEQSIESGSVRRNLPAGAQCTVTVWDLVGGMMHVTDVRRFVDEKPLR